MPLLDLIPQYPAVAQGVSAALRQIPVTWHILTVTLASVFRTSAPWPIPQLGAHLETLAHASTLQCTHMPILHTLLNTWLLLQASAAGCLGDSSGDVVGVRCAGWAQLAAVSPEAQGSAGQDVYWR